MYTTMQYQAQLLHTRLKLIGLSIERPYLMTKPKLKVYFSEMHALKCVHFHLKCAHFTLKYTKQLIFTQIC